MSTVARLQFEAFDADQKHKQEMKKTAKSCRVLKARLVAKNGVRRQKLFLIMRFA